MNKNFKDEVTIFACSGKGGDGLVHFKSYKGRPKAGPDGGDGGDGGDVIAVAVDNLAILSDYRPNQEFKAGDGEQGRRQGQKGAKGEDVIIEVPVGSVLKVKEYDLEFDLDKIGKKLVILKGGKGGRGNLSFKSSTNRAPKQSTKGKEGICAHIEIQIRLIADIGFIGLPNAGKSSLLQKLTNANVKIADYEFTTLTPNLGVLKVGGKNIVLADIPGLIKGASEGRGLGTRFLKHIMRTKALVHCISVERDNILGSYEIVRSELESYDKELLKKKELILLTKKDLISEKDLERKIKQLKTKTNSEIMAVSIYDRDSLKKLIQKIKDLALTESL